jgi:polyisoprenoid-binding protein YceI
MKKSIVLAVALASSIAATSSHAAWRVDNRQSTFTFVTAKAGTPGTAGIEEVQAFKEIGGSVGNDGKLDFSVDLASVETNIPLRNDRLRDLLFKVANHPQAVFTGSIDAHRFDALPVGATADVELAGQLTIAGETRPLTASLRVVKLTSDALLVGTRMPVVVNLKDYGLQDGVEALRTVMNLNVLASSAPVSFSIVLRRQADGPGPLDAHR